MDDLKRYLGRYLLHDLNIDFERKVPNKVFSEIFNVAHYNLYLKGGNFCSIVPYLRPMRDLVKPHLDNGKSIIPIAILCEICNNWMGKPVEYHSDNIAITATTEKGFVFGYDANGFYIKEGFNAHSVGNQLLLWEKLYEWHFDVHDLIGKKLAKNIDELSKTQ